MEEEELNYCSLALLLTRVGLEKLRPFFMTRWDSVSGCVSWTDCPQNGTDLLAKKKFKPKPYEKHKAKSGDTATWDLALFAKALLYTQPPLVPKSEKALFNGLNCLKETRNKLCHTGNGKIGSSEYRKLYSSACNALMLIGATSTEFQKVKKDVKQPWSEVLSLLKCCASKDDDILKEIGSITRRLDKVDMELDKVQHNQQQSQKALEELLQGQSDLQQGQSVLQQGQSDLLRGLSGLQQGQSGLQQGQSDLLQGQSGLQQGQSDLQQGQSDLQQEIEALKEQQEKMIEGIQRWHELPAPRPSVTSRLDKVDMELDKVQQNQQQSQKRQEELLQGQSDLQQGQSDLQQGIEALKEGQEKMIEAGIQMRPEPTATQPADVELFSRTLKESITKQTAILPQGIDLPRLKTDEIFTNLTVYQGKEKSLPSRDQQDRHIRSSGKTVKQCSEIFVAGDGEKCNPKSILVSGEPGIGKTLFSLKMLRDWSTNCLKVPDIQVTCLITFRQLAQLGDSELTLQELLNLSPLLDDKTQINETVMEWIVGHPEQLLIVVDGFDEYKGRNNLLGDFESQFANNVYKKMPVAALVSKLIQKKILNESVIMVTSRPGEADELDKNVHFDKYVDITGFTETQILEYVEKYFSSKPKKVKEMALEKIKETAHCMAFAQVPLMCFLLCVVIDWEVQNNLTRNYSNSLTRTQFYLYIIQSLERNNKAMRN